MRRYFRMMLQVLLGLPACAYCWGVEIHTVTHWTTDHGHDITWQYQRCEDCGSDWIV